MSSWDANPVQAPPGGFNFAGGSSNISAPTTDRLDATQETPRVPPNTASSTSRDTSLPIQSNTTDRERGTYSHTSPRQYYQHLPIYWYASLCSLTYLS